MKLELLTTFTCLAFALACRSDATPPPRTVATPIAEAPRAPVAPAPVSPPPRAAEAPRSIVVAEDIRSACGMAEPKTFFAYNSSKLRQTDRRVEVLLAN